MIRVMSLASCLELTQLVFLSFSKVIFFQFYSSTLNWLEIEHRFFFILVFMGLSPFHDSYCVFGSLTRVDSSFFCLFLELNLFCFVLN
jgi:hypothetical protein